MATLSKKGSELTTAEMTPAEVAARIGKSRNSIIDLIKTGEMEARDVRNAGSNRPIYRIRTEAVERWLDSRRVRPTVQVENDVRRKSAIDPVFARMRAAKHAKKARHQNQGTVNAIFQT